MHSWHHVTVGVASLAEASQLWQGRFGLEPAPDPYASDEAFAALWQLSLDAIGPRRCLGTPRAEHGRVHLVEFGPDAPSVREGAAAFDRCPKNLDVHAIDLPTRVAELQAAGAPLKNAAASEVTAPDGTRFREIHMAGHDDTNIVLLEVIGETLPFTDSGYAGVGLLISTVNDRAAEQAFWQSTFDLALLNHNRLDGPEIEQMIGLPAGSALDVAILGEAEQPFGRIELVEYLGVDGASLYERTQPPARGVLSVSYAVDDIAGLAERLLGNGVRFETVLGRLRFASPNGLAIEAFNADALG